MLASFLDGTLIGNIRLGIFATGTLALSSIVLSWTRDESEEVKKAREIVEEADQKNRLSRLLAFTCGVAALYGTIQVASYITSRPRSTELGEYDTLPTELMYSD